MEYQFIRDFLGQPVAQCELECEAFGDWLTNDLGSDLVQLERLLTVIEKLQNNSLMHYQHLSKEYYLEFDKEEVELFLTNPQIAQGEFAETDSEHTNNNLAGCGLADFLHLLKAWRDYLN